MCDIFGPMDGEWAIATRVQGDRAGMIASNGRAKPPDPSLPPTPQGMVPTTAKVGIDATIPEGVPRERYERISYAYSDRAKIEDYVKGKADNGGENGGGRARGAAVGEVRAPLRRGPRLTTS